MTTPNEITPASQLDPLHNIINAARELMDTELAEIACTGSDAPVEHALGMLADALACYPTPVAQEPVGWQFYQDGKWYNGMDTNNHRANTEDAGYPTRDVYAGPVAHPVAAQAQIITPSDAKTCAEALRNGLTPAVKVYIPNGWNALLDKLDAIAGTQQPVSGADGLTPDIKETIRLALIARHDAGTDQNVCDDALNWLVAQPQPSGSASDEPDWLQRLRHEQSDLRERQEKLEAFIARPAFRSLDEDSRNLLERQFNQQHVLLQTMNQRLNGGIERHRRSKIHG